MIVKSLQKAVLVTGIAMIAAIGTYAQSTAEQYREWQRAQRQAQQSYRQYQRSGDRDDFREWQAAQQRAQLQYNQYQMSQRGYYGDSGYNNGYDNRYGRTYRVYRNGSYYQVDERGANLLRQAVNSGYQQGFRQGQLDRRYRRGSSYYDDNGYLNGSYGYQSYVERDQYQYYFRQGFERGYQDGYANSNRYGYRSGNSFNILGTVLNTILNFAQN